MRTTIATRELGHAARKLSTGWRAILLGWEPEHDWRTAAGESVSVSLTAD